MLMRLYLDDAFQPEYLEMAANITSEEYYVNMMIAWYLATSSCKAMDCNNSISGRTTTLRMGTQKNDSKSR